MSARAGGGRKGQDAREGEKGNDDSHGQLLQLACNTSVSLRSIIVGSLWRGNLKITIRAGAT